MILLNSAELEKKLYLQDLDDIDAELQEMEVDLKFEKEQARAKAAMSRSSAEFFTQQKARNKSSRAAKRLARGERESQDNRRKSQGRASRTDHSMPSGIAIPDPSAVFDPQVSPPFHRACAR